MAITDGSLVMLKILSTDFTHVGDFTAQPPINGIVYGLGEGSSCSVLWSNGTTASSVPTAILDEIVDASDETRLLLGKTVNVAGFSPNYESIVVDVFSRDTVNEGAIIRSVSTGTYREVAASDLVVVPGH